MEYQKLTSSFLEAGFFLALLLDTVFCSFFTLALFDGVAVGTFFFGFPGDFFVSVFSSEVKNTDLYKHF